jgi:flagellar biosynthesis protein FlhF
VYADLLGVRLERLVPADVELEPEELVFVDLPGISTQDASAMEELGRRITEWPPTEVHLVLNSAYETTTLLSQARAFASLPIQDVIVTHLDEEPRWGKLWNLVLGTNCSLRFLSAGQNVPGQFQTATAEGLLARVFP